MKCYKLLAIIITSHPVLSYGNILFINQGVSYQQQKMQQDRQSIACFKLNFEKFKRDNQGLLSQSIRHLQQGTLQERMIKFLFISAFWEEAKGEINWLIQNQVKAPIWRQIWGQNRSRIETLVEMQVWGQIWDELWEAQFSYMVKDDVKLRVEILCIQLIRDRVKVQISQHLPDLPFGSILREDLEELLRIAIDYTHAIYQSEVLKYCNENDLMAGFDAPEYFVKFEDLVVRDLTTAFNRVGIPAANPNNLPLINNWLKVLKAINEA